MKKIVLCGEYYSSNFGDGIIVDSTDYLLKKISTNNEIVLMDFSARRRLENKEINNNYKKTDAYRKIIKGIQKSPFLLNFSTLLKWNLGKKKKYEEYYRSIMKDSTILVFSGGHIIMNNSLEYPLRLELISKIAKEYNTSIIFNSCGSEKTSDIIGKKILKKVLLADTTKVISVRDNTDNIVDTCGKEVEKKKLYESNDPAVLIADAYNIRKKNSIKIGLGVISHIAYVVAHKRSNNSYYISEEELIKKWIEILVLLKEKEYEVEIFTNGGHHDNAIALKLKEALPFEIDIKIPNKPQDLVEIISNYTGIAAHRLHANIIAYSLNVPSIGLVWDEKLYEFGKKTSRTEYYQQVDKSAIFLVEKLEKTIREGINLEKRQEIIDGIIKDFEIKINLQDL